jgi:mono/diheme cytochrome c family protein
MRRIVAATVSPADTTEECREVDVQRALCRPTVAATLGVCALMTLSCRHAQVPLPKSAPIATDAAMLVAAGESIVRNVAVCGHCHAADPAKDVDGPLSGGKEFHDRRIGTVRASNLTPDDATGLGTWSDAEIVRALRNGQRKDGRVLAPVMPYEWFNGMSDEDAFAVARYLKSLPPVRHDVRQSHNLLFNLVTRHFLGPKPAISASAPPLGATAEFGGYLAQHVGLCADCHTPRRGIRSTPDKGRLFAGDAHPSKFFPSNPSNLTPDTTTGIGAWSEEDFLRTLRTGVNPKGEDVRNFMPWRQIRRMSDDDLRAIYRYLRTLPPIHNEVPR